ncbi:pantothenate kinase 2-like [Magnolia sinica]|uniref:pantothenate kinase 2-like n=1 Tax=Magnolia sinica TaxID=86752 RepID=UPI002657B949|nr:pantothenate kinase 2-like [Magnolia sinica]
MHLAICILRDALYRCAVGWALFSSILIMGYMQTGPKFSPLLRILALISYSSFDELLELSQRGDNKTINMLVGDIYGGMDYSKIGLSASTIASSFGKAISENKELSDYRPEDISPSLLRMISYNIGQVSCSKMSLSSHHHNHRHHHHHHYHYHHHD